MGEKIYIIDTSALIENPGIISKLKGKIFLPEKVMRELDGLKKSADKNVNYNARKASQDIEKNINRIKIAPPYEKVTLLTSEADNQVIGTAIHAKKQGLEPLVLSTDRNIRIAVKEKGIEAVSVGESKKNGSKKMSPLTRRLWTVWAVIVMALAWICAVSQVPHEMGHEREFIPFVVGFLFLWIERIIIFVMITFFIYMIVKTIIMLLYPSRFQASSSVKDDKHNDMEAFFEDLEESRRRDMDDLSAGLTGVGPYSSLGLDWDEKYGHDDDHRSSWNN